MAKGKRDHFPGYPHLKRVAHSAQYGRMELLDVTPTSDGFLLGTARIGTGRNAYVHSVFLGSAPSQTDRLADARVAYTTAVAAQVARTRETESARIERECRAGDCRHAVVCRGRETK